MRYAGQVLGGVGATGGGMLLGAAAMDAATGPTLEELNAGKPSWAHYNTQVGHATNNAERMWTDLSQEDYAVVEGVRQALMGNRVTREEVIALADQGVISPKQFFYLGDVLG